MGNKTEYCICCGREIPEGNQYCIMCGYGAEKKQTNYDRIRNMSVGELAEFLDDNYKCKQCDYYHKCCNGECIDGIKQWLESEVDTE